MPFTPAHTAIVLPLAGSKRFSFTALIAGSMVPDFEFFFRMREVDNIGHQWYGVLLFDFPVALLCCYLFHNLLRNLFLDNMPSIIRRKFMDVYDFNWNQYSAGHKLIVTVSLLTGIATHILWDGFTHYDGIFAELIPALSNKTGIPGFNVPVYFLLQLLSSVIGLMIIAYAIYRIPAGNKETKVIRKKIYWPMFIVVLSVLLAIRLILWSEYNSFWSVFMAVMGAFCYSWLVVSVIFNFFLFKKSSI